MDKHAPKNEADLVGNKGPVASFKSWLLDWEDVVIRGHKKPIAFSKGNRDPPKLNARACLISGPPGIGKSTAVKIISETAGFHVF